MIILVFLVTEDGVVYFIEITLWHGCSPVNLLRIFRTPFLENISGRLLLNVLIEAGLASGNARKGEEETKYIDRSSHYILLSGSSYPPS